MKKYLIALLLACSSYLSAAGWSTAGTIPLGGSGAFQDVTMAYYPKLKKVVAAWANASNGFPYYSVYDGITNTWTTAMVFSASNTIPVQNNVNLQLFPKKSVVVAAWANPISKNGYFSVFNGTSWTAPGLIAGAQVLDEINMTYDKLHNRIIAAWAQSSNANRPYYSILDSNLTSWTTPAIIDPNPSDIVNQNVNLAYNKVHQIVLAAWGNLSHDPVYSTFDVTTSTWSAVGPIPQDTSVGVYKDIRVASILGSIPVAWADNTPQPRSGYTNEYNDPTWDTADNPIAPISPDFIGVLNNLSFGGVKDSPTNFMAAWAASTTPPTNPVDRSKPFYLTMAVGGVIPYGSSSGATANVNLMYDQNSGKIIAVWGDTGTGQPYFNTYQF